MKSTCFLWNILVLHGQTWKPKYLNLDMLAELAGGTCRLFALFPPCPPSPSIPQQDYNLHILHLGQEFSQCTVSWQEERFWEIKDKKTFFDQLFSFLPQVRCQDFWVHAQEWAESSAVTGPGVRRGKEAGRAAGSHQNAMKLLHTMKGPAPEQALRMNWLWASPGLSFLTCELQHNPSYLASSRNLQACLDKNRYQTSEYSSAKRQFKAKDSFQPFQHPACQSAPDAQGRMEYTLQGWQT